MNIIVEKPDQASSINTFCYCNRRWYYQDINGIFITNDHVNTGKYIHDNRKNGVKKRKELFIVSDKWNIKGKVDYVETVDGELIPVEIKKSRKKFKKPPLNDVMQLTCGAILLEERFGKIVRRGKLLYDGSHDCTWIKITRSKKMTLKKMLKRMRESRRTGKLPKKVKNKNKCTGCSIKPYCWS
jgi:CRISPR-associated protein Cas4